jgi:DNA-binding PucR family transcriptional regulator
VREVLDGRVPGGSFASQFRLPSRGPFAVMAFDAEPAEGEHRLPNPDRILSVISLYCEDVHPDAMCACVDDRFWTLLPTPRARSRELTVALATKIVDRVERGLQVRLAAGIGGVVAGVADVPRSRRAAEQALEVGAQRPEASRVVHIEDVHAHAVLLELLEIAVDRPALAHGKVEALAAHDREHGTDYCETLRVYLDRWGDVTSAARRLGVHANTMRYRVRRLVEVSGIDLDDPDERFVTELQLRVAARTAERAE